MSTSGEPRYIIEQWSEDELQVTRTVGDLDDLEVAKAAFVKAAEKGPGKPLTLRRGSQMILARWTQARRRERSTSRIVQL
jgi:hypothetical protein